MPQYFQRGFGPLCSVLLPTRGRVKDLCEAVDSLYSLAQNKDNVEFVFKADTDDLPTIRFIESLKELIGESKVKAVISPRGDGYHSMHEWCTAMALVSTGDWLLLFNDDARMRTEGWDGYLRGADLDGTWHKVSDVCLLVAPTLRAVGGQLALDPFVNEFIFMRRKCVEIMGHFSASPHNDNYLWSVFLLVASAFRADIIHVTHLSEHMKDEVREASEAAYKVTVPQLNSPEVIKCKLEDAAKLLAYVEGRL